MFGKYALPYSMLSIGSIPAETALNECARLPLPKAITVTRAPCHQSDAKIGHILEHSIPDRRRSIANVDHQAELTMLLRQFEAPRPGRAVLRPSGFFYRWRPSLMARF
jgi:hypothetical protein